LSIDREEVGIPGIGGGALNRPVAAAERWLVVHNLLLFLHPCVEVVMGGGGGLEGEKGSMEMSEQV